MNARRRTRPRQAPELVVLYACLFVVMVGYGSTLIVLPYHVQRIDALAGAPPDTVALQVGLLTGVYALAQLLAGPLVGRQADRLGHRNTLLGGLVWLAATQAAFGLTASLPLLCALRFLGGIAAAAVIVAATAYVTHRTTEQDRTRGMAWFGTSVSLGLIAGPAMAGVLSRPGIDIGAGPFRIDGYSIPFLFSAALTLATVAYAQIRLAHPARRTTLTRADITRPQTNDVPRLRTLLGLVAAAQYGLAIFEGTFVLYARDRLSLTAAQTSIAFIVCGAMMALLQVPASGVLAKVASPLSQVAIGFALMGIGITALLTTESYPVVLLMVAVLAAGAALVIPNLSALVSLGARTSTGVALGWKTSAGSLGQFLGPVVGGSLIANHARLPFLMAGLLLIAVAVGIAISRSRPSRRTRMVPTADGESPPAISVAGTDA
jgi:DHA1 family multidrug resistance protein-like MFS transporter